MSIDLIKIKNFRSLADVSFNAKALTVFVGCNDEGKSNILRALDLFFNGTNGGYSFNWERDFSGYAKVARNKAPQIEISLTFSLPVSFNVKQQVVWKRIWRTTGLYDEYISLADGTDLPSRSKAYAYLKAMRYEYVPAIKGAEYFAQLLGAVHDMLDATVQSDIRRAAANFTSEIRSHTSGILHDLEKQLGLKSELELPTDLKKLFTELEFRSIIGSRTVALSERGDGIKVRHIPIILRWLAEQANHLSAPGRPRVITIWGYEEPENNLETRRCFDLAEFFLDSSSFTQTFLTTHSPVFYSVIRSASEDNISLSEVKLAPGEGTNVTPRSIGQPSDVEALHSSIGFLDLLEPHVREWRNRVDMLQKRIDEGVDTDCPTIFVEGPSDKTIFEAIISSKFPHASNVKVLCSQRNGGGHGWVKDSLIAWHHSRPHERAIGLFDGDDASIPSLQEFRELVEDRSNGKTKAFKYQIKPDGIAREVHKVGLKLQVAIEELCPIEVWDAATAAGWLENRSRLPELYSFRELDETFNEWLAKKLPDNRLLVVAKQRVGNDYKEKFSKLVVQSILAPDCKFDFQPLLKLTTELLKKLNIDTAANN